MKLNRRNKIYLSLISLVSLVICWLVTSLLSDDPGFADHSLPWRRHYVLRDIYENPAAMRRLALAPSKRKLSVPHETHPVNLGYATFDTGSTKPVSINKIVGNELILSNEDYIIFFPAPYGPGDSLGESNRASTITQAEEKNYPHTFAYFRLRQTNFFAAEMLMEETKPVPDSEMISMSPDDFRLYWMKTRQKSIFNFGPNEVQFFENPFTKGIVRIGETNGDRSLADILLASIDGKKEQKILFSTKTKSNFTIMDTIDPIIASFRFSECAIDDHEKISLLIQEAFLRQSH